MNSYLDKYGYIPDNDEISRRLEAVSAHLADIASENTLKACFSIMDLTTLRTEDTEESVKKMVEKVNKLEGEYPDYPLPASICVYPNFASVVASTRASEQLHVTTVAGCFPSSQSYIEVKVKECEMAVLAGADEIDIVLALNSFLAKDYEKAGAEIKAMREAIDKAGESLGKKIILKVIIETGLLVTSENIATASFLAMENGADFIKTSTGKVSVNATPMSAFIMCESIKAFYEKTGIKVGFKAAGGISSAQDATVYYMIVNMVLGDGWLNKDYFRLGVSRLGNSLMSAIEKQTINFF